MLSGFCRGRARDEAVTLDEGEQLISSLVANYQGGGPDTVRRLLLEHTLPQQLLRGTNFTHRRSGQDTHRPFSLRGTNCNDGVGDRDIFLGNQVVVHFRDIACVQPASSYTPPWVAKLAASFEVIGSIALVGGLCVVGALLTAGILGEACAEIGSNVVEDEVFDPKKGVLTKAGKYFKGEVEKGNPTYNPKDDKLAELSSHIAGSVAHVYATGFVNPKRVDQILKINEEDRSSSQLSEKKERVNDVRLKVRGRPSKGDYTDWFSIPEPSNTKEGDIYHWSEYYWSLSAGTRALFTNAPQQFWYGWDDVDEFELDLFVMGSDDKLFDDSHSPKICGLQHLKPGETQDYLENGLYLFSEKRNSLYQVRFSIHKPMWQLRVWPKALRKGNAALNWNYVWKRPVIPDGAAGSRDKIGKLYGELMTQTEPVTRSLLEASTGFSGSSAIWDVYFKFQKYGQVPDNKVPGE